jgi:cysteine desulfurase
MPGRPDTITAMNTPEVYADYAATTPTEPRVVEAMSASSRDTFGNPSSAHAFGRAASDQLSAARQTVAEFLNAEPGEIYFTASGTESNNLALIGCARAARKRGSHIITSSIEHPSIINACRALEKDGFEVTYVKPQENGVIWPEDIAGQVTDSTVLVSLHLANSEIGLIQDISAVAKAVKAANPLTLLHTDACQASSLIALDSRKLGVDLLTFNGSKAYGPKGVAALFVKSGTAIFPLVYGGGQERSLRSGTENTPAVVGLGVALKIINENRSQDYARLETLRDDLQAALDGNTRVRINCLDAPRLPNHLSVTLAQTSSKDLVGALDQLGIMVSSGSACSSREIVESHVLAAIGLTGPEIHQTIRITLGRPTSAADCRRIAAAVLSLA